MKGEDENMKTSYIVTDILHSGRKGERNTPVDDIKYQGLIGYKVGFDVDEIERGEEFKMWVLNSPYYRDWYTSMVIAAWINEQDHILTIETENSLYVLKECNDD